MANAVPLIGDSSLSVCELYRQQYPLIDLYNANTKRNPSSMACCCVSVSLPIFSVRNDLLTVINCETLTTDSFRNPVVFAGSRTLPGACATFRFDVTTAASTVRIR